MRRAVLLLVLAVVWEAYARSIDNDLIVPSLSAVLRQLARSVASGVMPGRVADSLTMLLEGYAIGVALAVVVTTLAITTKIGNTVVYFAMVSRRPVPLPAGLREPAQEARIA